MQADVAAARGAAAEAAAAARRAADAVRAADRELHAAARALPRGASLEGVEREMRALEAKRERTATMTLAEEKALLKQVAKLRGVKKGLLHLAEIQERKQELLRAQAENARRRQDSEAGVREAEARRKRSELCAKISAAKGGVPVALETLVEKTVAVPKDRIGQFVGKQGVRLEELERANFVAVQVAPSGQITIIGVPEDVEAAAQEVAKFCDEVTTQITLSAAEMHVLKMDKGSHLNTIESLLNVSITLTGDSMWVRGQPEDLERVRSALKDLGAVADEVKAVPNGAFLRMLLAQGGAEIQALEKAHSVTLDLDRAAGCISILGRASNVAKAAEKLRALALENEEQTREIALESADQAAAIVGKKGATVRELQQATGAHITVVKPTAGSRDEKPRVLLRGVPATLGPAENAVREALEKHAKENVVVEFPEPFHAVLFGVAGAGPSRIKEIQDASEGASLVAHRRDGPASSEHEKAADGAAIRIVIRGPEEAVAKAAQDLRDLVAALKVDEVAVPEETRSAVIGQKGAIVSQLQRETQTSISLHDGKAVIRGRDADVAAAKSLIETIIERYARENTTVLILASAAGNIVGKGGATLRRLREETGAQIDVQMDRRRGPQGASGPETPSDKFGAIAAVSPVRVRAEDPAKIEAAIEAIKALVGDALIPESDREAYREVMLPIPSPEAVRRLVGKNGDTIRKLQEDFAVQIDILRGSQQVRVRGKAGDPLLASLDQIRGLLEAGVHVKERLVDVPQRVLSALADASAVRRIQEETGAKARVEEETPKDDSTPSYLQPKEPLAPIKVVYLEGAGPSVEAAKLVLGEMASGIDHELVRLPEAHLAHLAQASEKPNLDRLESQHKVSLQLNEARSQIRVAGKPKNLAAGKAALFALLRFNFPDQILRVPLDNSSLIAHVIGKKGATIRKVQNAHPQVQINVLRDTCSVELISAETDAVRGAQRAIEELVSMWHRENVSVQIPIETIPTIIGKKGASIQEIRKTSGVGQIDVDRDAACVRVRGPADAVAKARELIESRVAEYERENGVVSVDPADIPLLIGPKGVTIKAIQEESGARIDVSQAQPGTVRLQGPEEAIAKARHLIETRLEEERQEQTKKRLEEEERRRQRQLQLQQQRKEEEEKENARAAESKRPDTKLGSDTRNKNAMGDGKSAQEYAQMQRKIDQLIGIAPLSPASPEDSEPAVPLGVPVELDTSSLAGFGRRAAMPGTKTKAKTKTKASPPHAVPDPAGSAPDAQLPSSSAAPASPPSPRVSGSQVMSMLLGGAPSSPGLASQGTSDLFMANGAADPHAVPAAVGFSSSSSFAQLAPAVPPNSASPWSSSHAPSAPPGLEPASIWARSSVPSSAAPPATASRAPPGFSNPGLPSLAPEDETFYKSVDGFSVRL